MKACLLDINVLLALAWPNHPHHADAHRWFETRSPDRWATCTVTQLGFIRISSNPAFSASSVSPSEAHALLTRWTESDSHEFWNDESGGLQGEAFRNVLPDILTHNFLTDAYLVSVARVHGGRLATFDRPLHRLFPDSVERLGSS